MNQADGKYPSGGRILSYPAESSVDTNGVFLLLFESVRKVRKFGLYGAVMNSSDNGAIVFVHGLLGFSSFSILGKKVHYFRNLHSGLQDSTRQIFFPELPATGYIEDRARVLANFLTRIRVDRIDLIAHSMGGLDCRYLIDQLDPMHRVRSLTTIATPHHGSPLATWTIERSDMCFRWMYSISTPAVHDLTPEACVRFNRKIGDREDVRYCSYASMRSPADMMFILRPWGRMIAADSGDNDGMVSVASAQWGEFRGVLQADHFELTGWSFALPNARKARPFNHLRFYRDLVREPAENQSSPFNHSSIPGG